MGPFRRNTGGPLADYPTALLALFVLPPALFPGCETKIIKRVPRVPRRLHDRSNRSTCNQGRLKVAVLPLQLEFRQIIVMTTKHVLPSLTAVVTIYVFIRYVSTCRDMRLLSSLWRRDLSPLNNYTLPFLP